MQRLNQEKYLPIIKFGEYMSDNLRLETQMIVCAWKKPLNEQKMKAIMNVRNGTEDPSRINIGKTKDLK